MPMDYCSAAELLAHPGIEQCRDLPGFGRNGGGIAPDMAEQLEIDSRECPAISTPGARHRRFRRYEALLLPYALITARSGAVEGGGKGRGYSPGKLRPALPATFGFLERVYSVSPLLALVSRLPILHAGAEPSGRVDP